VRRRARAIPVLAGALALAAVAPARAAREIDYLYIDSSEGGGSGGHAALALGDRVFHFEHRAPGILHLAREPLDRIRRRYGVLENRTILVSRISVSEDTYTLVLDELTRRYLVERQHLADHQVMADDRALLELALARRIGSVGEPLAFDGAGFFFDEAAVPAEPSGDETSGEVALREDGVVLPGEPEPRGYHAVTPGDDGGARLPTSQRPSPSSPRQASALVALRERVKATHGADALPRAMRRVRAELNRLRPDAPRPVPPLAADRFAPVQDGLVQPYRDGVLLLLALQALDEALPLRPGSLAPGDLPELSADDAELVQTLAAALQSELVRLVASERPDRGFALLLGLARLIALDESARAGRWLVLDATPAASVVIGRERLRDPALSRGLSERASADFTRARDALLRRAPDAPFPEAAFAELEAAATRLGEIGAARAEGRDLRVDRAAPARSAPHRAPFLPAFERADLALALAAAREREAAHEAELKRVYGYNLFSRNCVTEIFRTLDAALARDLLAREPTLDGPELRARIRAASVERLGGHVDPDDGLNFIPAVSETSVREGYAVAAVAELPSYRRARLAEMYEREHPVRVFLRESNTLTSTLYERAPGDSAFLFFTDDVVAVRPVLGALNVIAGLGVAAAGLARLPLDGGAWLSAGLKGVVFSLPELAFFNIRKGSFPDGRRRPLEEPDRPASDR